MQRRSQALAGLLLALYLVVLPFVAWRLWQHAGQQSRPGLVRVLVSVLGVLWCCVVLRLVVEVLQRRRGRGTYGGFGWLAGVLLTLFTTFGPTAAFAATNHQPTTTVVAKHPTRVLPTVLGSAVPLALMAKRRRDELQQLRLSLDDVDVENALATLRGANPELLDELRAVIPAGSAGLVTSADLERGTAFTADPDDVVVVVAQPHDATEWALAFARPGGVLNTTADVNVDELADSLVALHRDGRVVVTNSLASTTRALALRTSSRVVVVHTGPETLDDELGALCVRVNSRQGARPLARPSRPLPDVHAELSNAGVRVHFLSAEVHVAGLTQPFQAELRRRCLEMVAYLAVHRHEPVTGDRLRSRVLGGEEREASLRTLSNTASAVRRSLGRAGDATRLLPVTPGGHYRTVDVDCDLEQFHALVAAAKSHDEEDGFDHLVAALRLVRGEPLCAELRGFEWFLAEGHLGRLQRDGEWAALTLSRWAVARGDVDLAYWAIEQGRLLDPYSDDLVGALARVPRLRQFGRDGGSRA